jgi:hypothetical protein
MVQSPGTSSLSLPRRFGFFSCFFPSTRIGSIGLDAPREIGSPTRILASSSAGFSARFSPDLSPGILTRSVGAGDGLGATGALSGWAGALASVAAFVKFEFPMPVAGPGAVRVGSGRGTGIWAGAWDGGFAGAGADAEGAFAGAGSFVDAA